MRALAGAAVLERKCACGKEANNGGSCAECAANDRRLLLRHYGNSALTNRSAPLNLKVPASSFAPSFGSVRVSSGANVLRKLIIGASNDSQEQEANQVAERVMAMPAHLTLSSASRRIQRYSSQASEGALTAPASVDRVLASSGTALEPALQEDMGQRFGHDFSGVRVHCGEAAEQSAREVNANAYTVGNKIVFGLGRFAPATHEGRQLIAHELTHVVQQSGSNSDITSRNSSFPPIRRYGGQNLRRDASASECTSMLCDPKSIKPSTGRLKLNALKAGIDAFDPIALRTAELIAKYLWEKQGSTGGAYQYVVGREKAAEFGAQLGMTPEEAAELTDMVRSFAPKNNRLQIDYAGRVGTAQSLKDREALEKFAIITNPGSGIGGILAGFVGMLGGTAEEMRVAAQAGGLLEASALAAPQKGAASQAFIRNASPRSEKPRTEPALPANSSPPSVKPAPAKPPQAAEEAPPVSGVYRRADVAEAQAEAHARTGTDSPRAGSGPVGPRPPALPAEPWVKPGYVSPGQQNLRATTPPAPRRGMPDIEFGKRKPSAADVKKGPSTLSEDIEERGAAAQTDEKLTTKRQGEKPLTPRGQTALAGKEMEASKIADFAQRNPDFQVLPNKDFNKSREGWLRKLFPARSEQFASGPDAVAISTDKRKPLIKVFDATGSPTSDHIEKTVNYKDEIKANLPEEFKGYKVEWEESYWQAGEKDRKGK